MKPSRITITRRHTGRFYLGMGEAEFKALRELFALVQRHAIHRGEYALKPDEIRLVETVLKFTYTP